MLDLSPVTIALPQARETQLTTSWGHFSARMWPTAHFGWLAIVYYKLGMDVTIQRDSPGIGMSEVEAAEWIQQAYRDGPRFIVALVSDAEAQAHE